MRPILEELRGRVVLVAFLDDWSPDAEPDEVTAAVRAELRGLGAVLVVATASRFHVFRPDDAIAHLVASPRELDAGRRMFEVPRAHHALFVLDEQEDVRFSHVAPASELRDLAAIRVALTAAAHALLHTRDRRELVPRVSRRDLVATALVAALALAFFTASCGDKEKEKPKAPDATGPSASSGPPPPSPALGETEVSLDVNGRPKTVRVDVRTSLLDALRERMGLPGTKKGCDHGQCGACTVLMDGRRVNACLVLAVAATGAKITTIEGLEQNGTLHPMQAAFIAEDALQCGYCTPGQIMSAIGFLDEPQPREGVARTETEIREGMSGNICRCGAYTNIVAAIRRVDPSLAKKKA